MYAKLTIALLTTLPAVDNKSACKFHTKLCYKLRESIKRFVHCRMLTNKQVKSLWTSFKYFLLNVSFEDCLNPFEKLEIFPKSFGISWLSLKLFYSILWIFFRTFRDFLRQKNLSILNFYNFSLSFEIFRCSILILIIIINCIRKITYIVTIEFFHFEAVDFESIDYKRFV